MRRLVRPVVFRELSLRFRVQGSWFQVLVHGARGADEAVEDALRVRLNTERPGDAVLGEERGLTGPPACIVGWPRGHDVTSAAVFAERRDPRLSVRQCVPAGISDGAAPVQPPQRVITEILGQVTDTAFRRLAGARVEILNGPAAGTAVVSDALDDVVIIGEFSGVLAFKATKAGFLPATTELNIQGLCERCTPRFYLALESVDPIVTFEPGTYTLTFTADPACTSLPVEARRRTYVATVSRADGPYTGSYGVRVPGVGLKGFHNAFLLGISGTYLATEDYAAPTFFERMTANTYVAIDFLIGTTTFDVVSSSGVSVPYCRLLRVLFRATWCRPGVLRSRPSREPARV